MRDHPVPPIRWAYVRRKLAPDLQGARRILTSFRLRIGTLNGSVVQWRAESMHYINCFTAVDPSFVLLPFVG